MIDDDEVIFGSASREAVCHVYRVSAIVSDGPLEFYLEHWLPEEGNDEAFIVRPALSSTRVWFEVFVRADGSFDLSPDAVKACRRAMAKRKPKETLAAFRAWEQQPSEDARRSA